MGGSGFPSVVVTFVALNVLFMVAIPLVVGGIIFYFWRGRVQRRGYPGLKAYLYELPQTDVQKLDALELTMKGAVLCVVGVFFFPILPLGLCPLYYGARKLASIRLGLTKADEEYVDAAEKPESQSL